MWNCSKKGQPSFDVIAKLCSQVAQSKQLHPTMVFKLPPPLCPHSAVNSQSLKKKKDLLSTAHPAAKINYCHAIVKFDAPSSGHAPAQKLRPARHPSKSQPITFLNNADTGSGCVG